MEGKAGRVAVTGLILIVIGAVLLFFAVPLFVTNYTSNSYVGVEISIDLIVLGVVYIGAGITELRVRERYIEPVQ